MRIIHVFRAPVGGILRHVTDLVRVQADMGHEVGVVCAFDRWGGMSELALDRLKPHCRLGIERMHLARRPAPKDFVAYLKFLKLLSRLKVDVIHGHGAKGGVLARLAGRRLGARAFYTPHGGSLNFASRSFAGFWYFTIEKILRRRTSGLLFVCDWERRCFDCKVGIGSVPNTVTYNGLELDEFKPVEPCPDASDILFIGELRPVKNVSVLLQAIALLNNIRPVTATIVGDGPLRRNIENSCIALGLSAFVKFTGARPAGEMLSQGRVVVVPSQIESLPYVVLEAVAAGIPVVATNVGGIPEILPREHLVKPSDVQALADALLKVLEDLPASRKRAAEIATEAQSKFVISEMARKITAFYTARTPANPIQSYEI